MANGKSGFGGRVIRAIVALLALVQEAELGRLCGRWLILRPEQNAAARGFRVAEEAGCFTCHGPAGEGGTTNPGSQEGTVPPFTEQTQMMYAKTPQALREYILDGAPAKKRDDPDYHAEMERAALQMPAYRDRLTTGQVDDLVVYLRAVSGLLAPTEALAAKGADLALKYDCFACHGPLGAGGVGNPGSLKGYVPGFWGADFDDLVRNDDELHTWIAEGKLDRIAEHPIGRIFFSRQRVKMPAYGRFLSADDITALAAFVRWVRAGDWRHGLE